MDLMKDIYKKELRTRIAAWEGKKTDDFQYEPERAELKAQMKDWLAENSASMMRRSCLSPIVSISLLAWPSWFMKKLSVRT